MALAALKGQPGPAPALLLGVSVAHAARAASSPEPGAAAWFDDSRFTVNGDPVF